MSTAELIEVVREQDGALTDLRVPRHEIFAHHYWCMSTNVFVMNHDGLVLCHQRSLGKERLPGAWSTHLGGHVSHGESYEENAQKELEEESGIVVNQQDLIPWRKTKHTTARLWIMEYVTLWNGDIRSLTPQPGEVEQFAWKSFDEIMREKQENPETWCIGTHEFAVEYHCMRSVLGAMHHNGHLLTSEHYHTWWPDVDIA